MLSQTWSPPKKDWAQTLGTLTWSHPTAYFCYNFSILKEAYRAVTHNNKIKTTVCHSVLQAISVIKHVNKKVTKWIVLYSLGWNSFYYMLSINKYYNTNLGLFSLSYFKWMDNTCIKWRLMHNMLQIQCQLWHYLSYISFMINYIDNFWQ